jgi:RNA-dependent RNA polymerase
VDYVKTGQPAEMPKRLKPFKWPHFMEKRHHPSYHSEKVLGQLYDKVESVDFVPQWREPFDKRILRAYKLDDGTLKAARQVKSEYDTAMRRIMAQHEINTEFEVWSTFVLSRPRVGSDYKVQEAMAVISDGLKEQFRQTCIERAGCPEGSKDFSTLGPFVAAMYKVTKEELDIALAECRMVKMVGGRPMPKRKMEQKFMPLISFPWLFEKELGRIATGMEAEDDLAGLGLRPLALKKDGNSRKRPGGGKVDIDDYIQQEDGVIVHRGEELDLFRPDVESDDCSRESDYEETSSVREDGVSMTCESGKVVLNTVFQDKPTPAHLLSDTCIEDIVPRTELDGFIDPQEVAQLAQNSDTHHSQPIAGSVTPVTDSKPTPGPTTDSPYLSVADLTTLDQPLVEKSSRAAGEELFEDIEEEMVSLDMEESSLEKLARMMNS